MGASILRGSLVEWSRAGMTPTFTRGKPIYWGDTFPPGSNYSS